MELVILWDEDGSVDIYPLSKKAEKIVNADNPDYTIEDYLQEKFGWNWSNHCTYAIKDKAVIRRSKYKI